MKQFHRKNMRLHNASHFMNACALNEQIVHNILRDLLMFACLLANRWWWKHTRTVKLTSIFNRIKFKPPTHSHCSRSCCTFFISHPPHHCTHKYIFTLVLRSYISFLSLSRIDLCEFGSQFIYLFSFINSVRRQSVSQSVTHTRLFYTLHQFKMHVCNFVQVLAAFQQQHQCAVLAEPVCHFFFRIQNSKEMN